MPEDVYDCEGCGGRLWALLAVGKVRCATCDRLAPDLVVGATKPDAATWGQRGGSP